MPRLYVLSGPDVGKSFEIVSGALVGRDAECAVRLRDPSVSRHHARLEHDSHGWSIVDTQSRNGIHFEKERVPRVELGNGAEFLLGDVLMRFRGDVAPVEPSAAPRPDVGPRVEEPRPVPRAAIDPDEIVLEGDWESPALEPTQPTVFTARSKLASEAPFPGGSLEPADTSRRSDIAGDGDAFGASSAVPFGAELARSPAKPATFAQRAVVAPRPSGVASANRSVLQYQRVQDRPGFFNADVAQQPLWLKLVLWLGALALFAGVFWFAFKGTTFLKSKAHHETSDAQSEENG
jgi:hypothetical protein